MEKNIRIGLIGCGGIAQHHVNLYSQSKGGTVAAVCDSNPAAMHSTGDKCSVPASARFADYRAMIDSGLCDAVDICTPNALHVPMAAYALEAGLPVCVEKPLGVHYDECVALEKLAGEKHLPVMICFSYRFRGAVRYARELVEQGMVGDIVNIYASYLKSSAYMPGRRLDWRFDRDIARYGVSGDLGVHILDLTTFLAGNITGVFAQMGTAVAERKKLDSEEFAPVTTDDWCHFLADFEGGTSATFSITRAAYGNENHIMVDIYGKKGALRFDLNNDSRIEIYREGMDINKTEVVEVPASYRANQQQCFIDLVNGKPDKYTPTLTDGVRMQKVLDALMDSAESRSWVDII